MTITDVGFGWTEECALLNHAHRWVKEQVAKTKENLPFPMRSLDGDNGDEIINRQLFDYCSQNQITFTRSRPYRKNDNCFIKQKNSLLAGIKIYEKEAKTPYQRLLESLDINGECKE